MDNIANLNRDQEAKLHGHAEHFVNKHHGGDTMRALKAMKLLNARLQEQLNAASGELKYPRQARG